ncbi:MAG: AraC family transcriptional regulator [Cytophagales bacterium]|nr:AraC family transcriptional regulator [Cytophagales bacterium]
MKEIIGVRTISEAHEMFGLEKPKHPLVTVYNHNNMVQKPEHIGKTVAIDLYHVMYKDCKEGSFQYGRNTYDFQEGTLLFTKPGQVVTIPEWKKDHGTTGWSLLFHPDLIRKSALGKHIDDYSFFAYEVNEALHLSNDEKRTIAGLRNKIIEEYGLNIDTHSQKLIVANIELMLDYCTRYYDRQFYTRTNMNQDTVSRFEHLLKDYYNSDKPLLAGIPTVSFCGNALHMSSNYLSDLLKKETGRNAREHIHFFLIDRAKTSLLGSNESVSQIAYSLGFEYPQHFSKLFKKKTGMSPAEYRSLN